MKSYNAICNLDLISCRCDNQRRAYGYPNPRKKNACTIFGYNRIIRIVILTVRETNTQNEAITQSQKGQLQYPFPPSKRKSLKLISNRVVTTLCRLQMQNYIAHSTCDFEQSVGLRGCAFRAHFHS